MPRVGYRKCEKNTPVDVSWARARAEFTETLEAFVMASCTQMPTRAVTQLPGVSDDRGWHALDCHVDAARGQALRQLFANDDDIARAATLLDGTGFVEGRNGRIQAAMTRARGNRTERHLIAISYLICTKLKHLPKSPWTHAARQMSAGRSGTRIGNDPRFRSARRANRQKHHGRAPFAGCLSSHSGPKGLMGYVEPRNRSRTAPRQIQTSVKTACEG